MSCHRVGNHSLCTPGSPSELEKSRDTDGDDDRGPTHCSDQQDDGGRRVPVDTYEVDLGRLGILGNEDDEQDQQHYTDHYCCPTRTHTSRCGMRGDGLRHRHRWAHFLDSAILNDGDCFYGPRVIVGHDPPPPTRTPSASVPRPGCDGPPSSRRICSSGSERFSSVGLAQHDRGYCHYPQVPGQRSSACQGRSNGAGAPLDRSDVLRIATCGNSDCQRLHALGPDLFSVNPHDSLA